MAGTGRGEEVTATIRLSDSETSYQEGDLVNGNKKTGILRRGGVISFGAHGEDSRHLGGFCDDLKGLGYKVKFDVKDAAQYGVPQRRRRLILLASRNIELEFAEEARRRKSVRGAIGHLVQPGKSKDSLHNLPEKRRSEKIRKFIRDIPKDGGIRIDLPRRRQLECHKKSDGFRDIYGRMAWDDVAPTITSGCFNPSKGRFLHPQRDRAITMREAALLQGFPKNYYFDVALGKQTIALMIGNALPPEFIRRHALEIRRALRNGA